MNIAIIGSGISGLTVAYLLNRKHQITVYESEDYIGGHTHTVEVELENRQYQVDTGFIVCNDRTYPNFLKLLDQLGVEKTATGMGFGIRSDRTGIEYSTTSLNNIFAQRRNLVSPQFIGMLRGILRFNKELTKALLKNRLDADLSLGNYLERNNYSRFFIDHFIVPMGAAIWSIGVRQMLDFPLLAFARFFHNHGLLSVNDQPQWYFVKGGSHAYVKKMTASFVDRIRLSTPVQSVVRNGDTVTVQAGNDSAVFDKVVFATHSDITLKLLSDPTAAETDILSAIGYQHNDIVLHTDTSILARNRKAWAPWNYHLQADDNKAATLTYNMSMLQQISAPEVFCVTLNETDHIDPARILGRYDKSHPVFNRESINAQQRYGEIGGRNNTFFSGAYWFNGFHEDGVNSALRVARDFGGGTVMESALYSGTLIHARSHPRQHQFAYNLTMILLDLDKLDALFSKSRLWVMERLGFVSFRRKDFLPDRHATVKEAAIRTVAAETGMAPEGPVLMLANLRYWGLQFNPASFYFCFDKSGEVLSHILIEVHNTPWGERHRYVLPLEKTGQTVFEFDKAFHVSPFNPMDMRYRCLFEMSSHGIMVQMENYKDGQRHFKAVLNLKRTELSPESMATFARNAWKLPFKIVGGIYAQALKLLLKRVPFYPHPQR